MVAKKEFDLNAGLLIQLQQLDEWKQVLNRATFKLLKEEADRLNASLTDSQDGYKVFRGTEMDQFIHNIMSAYHNSKIKK